MKVIIELLEHTKINDYIINLKKGKLPLYESIYSLKLEELDTLKTYLKLNLKNSFIQIFKSLAQGFILFIKTANRNLKLYINYQGFYNPRIKNQYFLLLIRKSLNCLK